MTQLGKKSKSRQLDRFFRRALLKEFPFLKFVDEWQTKQDWRSELRVCREIPDNTLFVRESDFTKKAMEWVQEIYLFDKKKCIVLVKPRFDERVYLLDLLDKHRNVEFVLVGRGSGFDFNYILYKRADQIIPPLEKAAALAAREMRESIE